MASSWFLWPQPRYGTGGFEGSWRCSPAEVEKWFFDSFAGRGFPVLTSSARVGLVLALEEFGLGRSDFVALFPYASHCVIESVGRVGTPVRDCPPAPSSCRVLYHQWGYVQDRSATGRIIEDAVDSFCVPGAGLFPAQGAFELWSLSKLLGCLGGGVLWCRDERSAQSVRVRRDTRNGLRNLRWTVRLLSGRWQSLVPYWYGAESLGGAPPDWGCADILARLHAWDELASSRRERLAVLEGLGPSWLPEHGDRLPTAVPALATESQAGALSGLGFSVGLRHFERIRSDGGRELVKVFPVPAHHDVPLAALKQVRRVLESAV